MSSSRGAFGSSANKGKGKKINRRQSVIDDLSQRQMAAYEAQEQQDLANAIRLSRDEASGYEAHSHSHDTYVGGGSGGGGEQSIPTDINVDDYHVDPDPNVEAEFQAADVGEMPPPEPEVPPRRKVKQRDLVSPITTEHFKKVPVPGSSDEWRLHCNYCPNAYVFRHGGGYGSLWKHMRAEHSIQLGISRTQTQLNFQPSPGTGSSQTSGNSTSNLFKYDHKTATDVMARFAAMKHFPYNAFDSIEYERSMQQAYNVAAKKISRTSITRSITKQCFEKKIQLGKYLVDLGHKVSICSDVWTDCFDKNAYMGITVHFVDSSWTLNKRLIAFREFPTPHTAQAIAQLIIQVLNEFSLINKIFSVGFDNASANTASIDELITACSPVIHGKYFHVRCIAHILNLCVQDALKLWQEHVGPIRTAVKLIHNKSSIGKAWKKYCHSKQIRYTTFYMDVSTRWNSTHDMIQSTLEHVEYLCDFFRSCRHAPSDFLLLRSCWDHSMNLFQLFHVFKDATVDLSRVYSPTSVRVLDNCVCIALTFNVCMAKANNLELQYVLFTMVKKWLKYFKNIPMVFMIAKCLDPKWKLGGVGNMLETYCNALCEIDLSPLQQMFNEMGTEESLELDLPNLGELKYNLDTSLRALFTEYETQYNTSHQRTSSSVPTSHDFGYDYSYNDPDVMTQLYNLYGRTTSNRAVSELDMYLESRSIFQDVGPKRQVDVLNWWGTHEKDFPILASMAKEIFAVPASTVAVEQAFSVGGCVLDDRRSRLSAKNMEATMLLDDWAKADNRCQEPDWDFQVESDGEEFTEDESE